MTVCWEAMTIAATAGVAHTGEAGPGVEGEGPGSVREVASVRALPTLFGFGLIGHGQGPRVVPVTAPDEQDADSLAAGSPVTSSTP